MNQTLSHLRVDYASVHAQSAAFVPCSSSRIEAHIIGRHATSATILQADHYETVLGAYSALYWHVWPLPRRACGVWLGRSRTTVCSHLPTVLCSSGTTVTTCCKQPHDVTRKPLGLPLAAARARLCRCKFRFEVEGPHTVLRRNANPCHQSVAFVECVCPGRWYTRFSATAGVVASSF